TDCGAGGSSSSPGGPAWPNRGSLRSEAGDPPCRRIASLYEAALTLSGFRRGLTRFLDRLPLDLPKRPPILDAGCGTGLMAYYLLRRLPRAEVVAFDLDRRMLAVMRRPARRPPGATEPR